MVKLSREPADAQKAATAMACDVRTSFKNTFNVAAAIRGMSLFEAKKYLGQVLEKKRIIPFRSFKSGVGRSAQCKEFKVTQGRWPVKSVKAVLGLLKNAESNAEFKNLDTEKLTIKHIQVNRAQQGRRRTYRAHGRINAYMSSPCHIEMILEEDAEDVAKADGKQVKFTKKQMLRFPKLAAAN